MSYITPVATVVVGFCRVLPDRGKNCQGFDETGKYVLSALVFLADLSVFALILRQFVAQGADTDSE
jgi:hypothetical protein